MFCFLAGLEPMPPIVIGLVRLFFYTPDILRRDLFILPLTVQMVLSLWNSVYLPYLNCDSCSVLPEIAISSILWRFFDMWAIVLKGFVLMVTNSLHEDTKILE